MSLNKRQQAIVDAIAAQRQASRNVVEQFELTLQEYWGVDRRNVHNLEFFLNAFKRNPRWQAAMRKLLPMYAPVKITGNGGTMKVENLPDASKRDKLQCKQAVNELVALKLSSLLAHPNIKVEIEWKWDEKKAESFGRNVQQLVDKGADPLELLKIVQQVAMKAAEEDK